MSFWFEMRRIEIVWPQRRSRSIPACRIRLVNSLLQSGWRIDPTIRSCIQHPPLSSTYMTSYCKIRIKGYVRPGFGLHSCLTAVLQKQRWEIWFGQNVQPPSDLPCSLNPRSQVIDYRSNRVLEMGPRPAAQGATCKTETDIPILKDIRFMKVYRNTILITGFAVGAFTSPGVRHGYVDGGCGQSLIVDSWRVYSVSSIKPWYIFRVPRIKY